MANLPQQNTIVQYQADGIVSSFAFNFYVPLPGDLNVYVTPVGQDPMPDVDIKVLNLDYTISTNVNVVTGGYITFLPGRIPPITSTVTLSRNVEASLDVEFQNATTLNGENLDDAFDRLLLLLQQNKTIINSNQQRVLSYKINAFQTAANIVANTQIPVLGPDQIWKGTGTGVIATTLVEGSGTSTLRSDLANQNAGLDGAKLVGYFDTVNNVPTTLDAFLGNLIPFVENNISVSDYLPPGLMLDFAGPTPPNGWLVCDGSLLSRTTYAQLFGVIGTTWGVGDGVSTFALPNLARRTTVGAGGTGTGVLGNAIGNVGGEEAHLLTIAEMPSHNHPGSTLNYENYQAGDGTPGILHNGAANASIGLTIAGQGGSLAHNIVQPSAIVNKIIKT